MATHESSLTLRPCCTCRVSVNPHLTGRSLRLTCVTSLLPLDSCESCVSMRLKRCIIARPIWGNADLYTSYTGRVYPIASRSIIQRFSLTESHDSGESQRNKDAVDTLDQCVSPSVGVPVLRLLRLTLMCVLCDSNNMYGTDNIS